MMSRYCSIPCCRILLCPVSSAPLGKVEVFSWCIRCSNKAAWIASYASASFCFSQSGPEYLADSLLQLHKAESRSHSLCRNLLVAVARCGNQCHSEGHLWKPAPIRIVSSPQVFGFPHPSRHPDYQGRWKHGGADAQGAIVYRLGVVAEQEPVIHSLGGG